MDQYSVIIAGSGDFTLKVIDKLRMRSNFNIIGVLPDPSAGDYNVIYREQLFEREIEEVTFDYIMEKRPDLFFSIEYRRIFPKRLVNNVFCLNLHGGILPKYRGISANAYAIMNDEREVGFTLHRITEELDDGEIYKIFQTEIAYEQTYSDVNYILKNMVLEEIGNVIVEIMDGKIKPKSNKGKCVYCNRFHKEDDTITNWNVTSRNIYNRWRCFAKPYGTGLHFIYRNEIFYAEKWIEGENLGIANYKGVPGKIVFRNTQGVYVKTHDNVIVLQNIFDEKGNKVDYGKFIIGYSLGGAKELIIVGVGEFAEIAYEYFTNDSDYDVVAFAVEREYKNPKQESLFGLPIVELEEIEDNYPPEEFELFIAITYVHWNKERERVFHVCKEKGYCCASYISSCSFVGSNVEIGENVFIFENNVIQYFVKVGDNTILWSGNHVGHRTKIGRHCWITSHDVISGFCLIGDACFLGVNATVGDKVFIASNIVLGAGAMTVKNLNEKGVVYIGNPAQKLREI